MKAKAIVFRKAKCPTLEEVTLPELEKGQVLVKIHYSGVSIGTESSIFNGDRTHNGTFPLVTGYMAAGTIEKVSSDVTEFKKGDRVICGGTKFEAGINSIWGGHCSYHVAETSRISAIPEKCDIRDASMYILPRVGMNAINMVEITKKDTVLISGQGLIGQFYGQLAAKKAARVITIEPDKLRAGLSKKYVTQNVLDPFSPDMEKDLERLTDGQWPTIVVEATANKKLIGGATKFIRRMNAKMIFLSWYPGEITLDYSHFHNWEVSAFFPMGAGDRKVSEAVLKGIAEKEIIIGDNITDTYDFSNASEGFSRISANDRSIMGMVIDWRNA